MIEENRVFGMQKKLKYGMPSNICYHLRAQWQADKLILVNQCGMVLPMVAGSFLGTLLPAEGVRGLEEGWQMWRLVLWLAMLAGMLWICHVAGQVMSYAAGLRGNISYFYYTKKVFRKMMYLDYDVMEQQQSVCGNVWKALRSGDDFQAAAGELPAVAVGVLGMLFYGAFIVQKNWLLLVLISVTALLKIRLFKLARRKHREEHAHLSRYAKETAYISRQSKESRAGKDIRIYGMQKLFSGKYENALKGMDGIFARIHNWYLFTGVAGLLISFLVNSVSYLYLTYLVSRGELSASSFVLYVGLVSGFTGYFNQVNRSLMNLNPFCASISYIREFLELQNRWGGQEKTDEAQPARRKRENLHPIRQQQEEIHPIRRQKEEIQPARQKMEEIQTEGIKLEFRDVSYTYPGKDAPTLSHINLVIRPGEKLALLGLNGAGKTTMVKLMCGFYEPTEGEVLLNDIPVRNYDREEYYSLIAVMFQDATMLPFSLDENLTGYRGCKADRERLERALELSGFGKKYHGLSRRGDTQLVKEVNKEAVDFSGGEGQKLVFARALYKDAPLLILDEPTAALDPIAENALYQNFGEAVKGRTSVYISHRLSSTRFCDRIVLLEQGRIVEEGTHGSLMAGDTRYARLYEMQSQYYREAEFRKKRRADMGDCCLDGAGETQEI